MCEESVSLVKWQKIGFRSMQLAWYWIFFLSVIVTFFFYLWQSWNWGRLLRKCVPRTNHQRSFANCGKHEATCLVEMPTGDNDRTDLWSRKVSTPWDAFLAHPSLAWPLPSNTSDDRNDWTLGSRNCSGDLCHGALANCPFLFLFVSTWTLNFFVINDGHLWIVRAWEFLFLRPQLVRLMHCFTNYHYFYVMSRPMDEHL